MRRFACDTFVLFSALFFYGKPGLLLEAVKRGQAELVLSEYLRDELARVIRRKGLRTGSLEALLELSNVRVVADSSYDSASLFESAKRFVRGPADWPVYAFFLGLLSSDSAVVLVSSDSGLPDLRPPSPLRGKILTPAQAVEPL
jgi:predicted nucleic acid-binding protein